MTVGVFVDEAAAVVREIAETAGLDWIQLHGQESPEYCRNLGRRVIKGFRIKDAASLSLLPDYRESVQAFLLDTYKPGQAGARGRSLTGRWPARLKNRGPSSWPGGLPRQTWPRPSRHAQPAAVDVASGIEAAPGKKDPDKLKTFFKAVKGLGGGG